MNHIDLTRSEMDQEHEEQDACWINNNKKKEKKERKTLFKTSDALFLLWASKYVLSKMLFNQTPLDNFLKLFLNKVLLFQEKIEIIFGGPLGTGPRKWWVSM